MRSGCREGAEAANRRATESDVVGDNMLLLRRKQNKLSTTDPYNVVSKKRDLVVIELGGTQLSRNVGHVKRFIGSTPDSAATAWKNTTSSNCYSNQ